MNVVCPLHSFPGGIDEVHRATPEALDVPLWPPTIRKKNKNVKASLNSEKRNPIIDVMKKTYALVKTLQDERDNKQKHEFTIWINSILQKDGMKVEDLFRDLSDGLKLTRLLELVFAEKFSRSSRLPRGKTRMQHIENVNRCLVFLRTKVPLPSIGAEDIVDGNHRLILGLVWTIMHGSPAKTEETREILPTQLPHTEQTTRLHVLNLNEPVNQESLKQIQQNNSSLMVEPEAVNVLEDQFFLQTTCVLQTKRNAALEKKYIEAHQNAVPIKLREVDDIRKDQPLQQKQEATEEIKVRYQDSIKNKQIEIEEDKNHDVNNQFEIIKQHEIQNQTNDNNSKVCPNQTFDVINEADEFIKEQLPVEQVNEQLDISFQYQLKKADELKIAQFGEQEQKETEPAKDYNIEELEVHLSVKEKHDQNGETEVKELELKESEDSYDKKQDDPCIGETEFLQNKNDLETNVLNGMHLTEQKQELDHQSIIELDRYDKEEVGDLKKLIFSELSQNQYHEDEESEIKQRDIEVDDEFFRIQKQESVEQPQQDNGIEKPISGSSLIDCNDDSENDSDYEVQSGTTSTPFLHELLKECNRRGLIEKQQEAKEKEEKEKRDLQFYKLLEQMSKDHGPVKSENEEIGMIFDEEKHKKEHLWKQREVERLQEEADRHREETERQEKLKYDREEEERQKQHLIDI